jgi:cyclophilin family peptidyl-prolyl cis-trans isomerase
VPSDKRARQRAGREARQAALAKAKRRRSRIRAAVIVVVIAVVVVGSIVLINRHSSSSTSASTSTTVKPTGPTTQKAADAAAVAAGCPASPKTTVNTLTWSSPPPMTVNTSQTYTATVATTAGTFVITLDATHAPQTVNNFVFLSKQGYFHCNSFFRVIPGFMNQTGSPNQTNSNATQPGYTIPDELPAKSSDPNNQYPVGSVAMANAGANTGGSQWFVVAGKEGQSLSNTYSLFGQVTSGMNVVQQINEEGNANGNGIPPKVTQRIISITISNS